MLYYYNRYNIIVSLSLSLSPIRLHYFSVLCFCHWSKTDQYNTMCMRWHFILLLQIHPCSIHDNMFAVRVYNNTIKCNRSLDLQNQHPCTIPVSIAYLSLSCHASGMFSGEGKGSPTPYWPSSEQHIPCLVHGPKAPCGHWRQKRRPLSSRFEAVWMCTRSAYTCSLLCN